tara:strand:+ start:12564 stop:12782 length:219 start_codon:yes stop_codon:yes gene_type:complete
MPNFSLELIQTEYKSWQNMKQALDNSKGNCTPFGRYMVDKYSLKNTELLEEQDSNMALLRVIRDHGEEFNKG